MPAPLKVALTGGIATGKSHVLARLRDRGIPTIDADDIVHQALAPGTPTTKAIAAEFGFDVLGTDAGVDRRRLGAVVFSDGDARRKAEAIIHPVVYDAILNWFATLAAPIGVASIPLLYETGHQDDFDVIVATVCSPEQQLHRILARDRISEHEARSRIAAQMPAEEKASRADLVIRTEGPVASTDRLVGEVVEMLKRKKENGKRKKE
jgi:dephospho-CoA kinase